MNKDDYEFLPNEYIQDEKDIQEAVKDFCKIRKEKEKQKKSFTINAGRRFGKSYSTSMMVLMMLMKGFFKISLFTWLMLKFIKEQKASDTEVMDGHSYTTVIYGKAFRGKLYIVRDERYVDGVLSESHKLKRKNFC